MKGSGIDIAGQDSQDNQIYRSQSVHKVTKRKSVVRRKINRFTYSPGQAVQRTPASLGISRPKRLTIQGSGAEIREGVVCLQTENILAHEFRRKHCMHNIKGRDHTLTASFTPRMALVGAILVR